MLTKKSKESKVSIFSTTGAIIINFGMENDTADVIIHNKFRANGSNAISATGLGPTH